MNKKISKLLIANRGEIAVRIIKTCKKLNIISVAVFSEADKQALFTNLSDEKYFIGESEPTKSYLNIDKIIEICKKSGADAVHPGYGFLSENPLFAEALEKESIIFIGPSANSIRIMGDKVASKKKMIEAGIEVIPGYDGENNDLTFMLSKAEEIGFPVMIKASAGGGGKGMRRVLRKEDFSEGFHAAKREAKSYFGNDSVFLEKLIISPRHIEVQILGDSFGNHLAIYDRDCSIQRRHQKIIEEAPAPFLSDELRSGIKNAAIKAAKSIGYENAGTVEFVLDKDNKFYFLEMNTRLQVEHPVTEMISGLDLVELQINISEKKSLPFTQENLPPSKGHAIELRICAEDGGLDGIPQSGIIKYYSEPIGIRVDSGVQSNSEVSVYYDSMIAKMIVWSDDRLTAIKKSIDSIKKFPIFGIPLNTQLLEKILNLNEFKNGNMNTGLLEDRASELKIDSKTKNLPTSAAIVHLINSIQVNKCFSDSIGNFRIWKNSINPIVHSINLGQLTTKSALVISDERVFVNGSENPLTFQVRTEQGLFEEICLPKVRTVLNDKIIFETDEELVFFRYGIRTYFLFRGVNGFADIYKEDSLNNAVNANYRSPMPGKIVSITVQKGNVYSEGDLLAIVEAMKMENQIRANSKILIDDILFNEGELIKPEDDIFKFSNLK